MTRLFLDTNIVIDLLEKREPFYPDAVRLFTMAYNKQVQLVVSPMTYATAAFLLRKHGPEMVRQQGSISRHFHDVRQSLQNPLLPPFCPRSESVLNRFCRLLKSEANSSRMVSVWNVSRWH